MQPLRLAAVVLLVGLPIRASGDLVGVRFLDQNLSTAQERGGPDWFGIVDTAADTLTIHAWDELDGHGLPFWTPSLWAPDLSLAPLVWNAIDGSGAPYDVPDSFGAGGQVSITSDWGFISPQTANEMAWENGVYSILPIGDYFPGWGVTVVQEFIAGSTTETEFVVDASATETSLPRWPIDTFGFRAAADATVTVVSVESVLAASASQLAAVPETTLGFPALAALLVAARRRRNGQPLR